MSEHDEHQNPYIRAGVGTPEDAARWSEAERRKHDPQWQTVEGLNYIIGMQGSIRACLVTALVLLALILWRVW